MNSLQSEVLLCPNCQEDVPKTLYCLNCGYPLYKVEMNQEEVEEVAEEMVELEEEAPVDEIEQEQPKEHHTCQGQEP